LLVLHAANISDEFMVRGTTLPPTRWTLIMVDWIHHYFELGHLFGRQRGLKPDYSKLVINNNKLLCVTRLDGPWGDELVSSFDSKM
jgi:hypothetical protein